MDTNQIIKDSQKDITNGRTVAMAVNNISFQSLFDKILLKTERLSSAVHIITETMNSGEPMRNRMRESSLDVSAKVLLSLKRFKHGSSGDTGLNIVKDSIDLLISYISVCRTSALCSSVNCDIMKDEYSKVWSILNDSISSFSVKNPFLPVEFFGPNQEEIYEAMSQIKADSDMYKNSIKDQKLESYGHSKGHETADNYHRKDAILSILSSGNGHTIKDIMLSLMSHSGSGKIKVGEKTVQRDLISLVNAGNVKKVGERRWSKYFIK